MQNICCHMYICMCVQSIHFLKIFQCLNKQDRRYSDPKARNGYKIKKIVEIIRQKKFVEEIKIRRIVEKKNRRKNCN